MPTIKVTVVRLQWFFSMPSCITGIGFGLFLAHENINKQLIKQLALFQHHSLQLAI